MSEVVCYGCGTVLCRITHSEWHDWDERIPPEDRDEEAEIACPDCGCSVQWITVLA